MWSLRQRLLVGILAPVLLLVIFNAAGLYRQALAAADTAYDRTLLASAKAIGELLDVVAVDGRPRLHSTVVYSALEAFEADNRSRIFFKVTGFDGELVSGFEGLPSWHGELPTNAAYAALVHFYDADYAGQKVRMAVLLQPVSGVVGHGMATIQVAETLELRRTLARHLLLGTLWRQGALLSVIALVVVLVVQRATGPVRALSEQLRNRREGDLSPVHSPGAPREVQPVVDAINTVMARLAQQEQQQKRFVRDASHQLRTPLAVLKTQVQSALRGDVDAEVALREIGGTVDRATELANQMLALAKVEQLRRQGNPPIVDWGVIVRAVALDLSALIGAARLDFDIEADPATVRAHEWALRELTRNLLHNAIRHTPAGGRLSIKLAADSGSMVLTISDSGPGLAQDQRRRLFEPFAASGPGGQIGLGLSICREIVQSLGGSITLENRQCDGRITGLDAVVRLARESQ